MSRYPLVSIIVPNYNHARFLRERLDSIYNQTYPNKEVILLDDCSTDDSVDVMQSYAGRPETKCLLRNEQNSGSAFVQWARGIEKADGEYIWIAESDDCAEPMLLESLYDALSAHGADVAFCASRRVDGNGRFLPSPQRGCWKRPFDRDGREFVGRYLLGYNHICNASAVLFRKSLTAGIGTDWTRYHASGDRAFWIALCLHGRVAYLPERLNQFRRHEGTVSQPAAATGLNLCEDYDIVSGTMRLMPVSQHRHRMTAGYHYLAMKKNRLTQEGEAAVKSAWGRDKYFNAASRVYYQVCHAIETVLCR